MADDNRAGGLAERLAAALVTAILEFRERLGREPIVCLDIGCFPWHGNIELSALTAEEFSTNPVLLERCEVASWRYYNFSQGMTSWDATADLRARMAHAYIAADDGERALTAEIFMQASAAAAESPKVKAAVELLPRDSRFRARVLHPDSGREFGV